MPGILSSFATMPFVSYRMYLPSNLCTLYSPVRSILLSTVQSIKHLHPARGIQDLFNDFLKIALATSIPTPHAEKTWSLVFWMIQVQNLPAAILGANKVEIVAAFRQSISGEKGLQAKLDSFKVISLPSFYRG
jgi:hypothetical protein